MLRSYQLKPMKFLLFFILLLIFQRPITAVEQIVTDCPAESSNFTSRSQFEENLDLLLHNLTENAPLNRESFHSTSQGDDPNKIYGFSQCMAGTSEGTCSECLILGSKEITRLCPNKKEASVRYYDCILLYSYRPFSSRPSMRLIVSITNTANASNPSVFNKILGGLLNDLSPAASSLPSKYATNVTNLSDFEKIYGMAQCTRDLSGLDCDSCWKQIIAFIPTCCGGKRGSSVYTVSCNIRYELYPFFDLSSSPSPTSWTNASDPTIAPQGSGTSPPSPSTDASPKGSGTPVAAIVIPIVIGVMLLSLAITCFIRRRSKKTNQEKKEFSQEELLHDLGPPNSSTLFLYDNNKETGQARSQELPFIDLVTIVAATNNFSNENKLGEGGFGPVYKGILPNEKEIAVKRLSRSSGQGLEEFKNEVTLIAKLQHKNLVRLLYCCIEKKEKLLIYEYMPNTSLDFFLFNPNKRIQLDWRRRYNIIVGIVRGLLYLHEDSRLKIIHRDMKASNVLLDHEMNPKISDFGMARIFQGNQGEANTNRVVGTYGYMAPEYAMEGLFSVKSDVFSFGVLLLEIVTGKRNGRFVVGEQAHSLLTYAWQVWSCGQRLELIDQQIIETCSVDEALKCIHIGLLCAQDDAANRPTMSTVFHMLGSESVALPSPTKPAFYTGNVVPVSNGSSTSAKRYSVNQITMSDIQAR